jgi:aminodeoxychorismate synthase component I
MPDAFITLHSNDENAFLLDREHNLNNRFSVMGAANRLVSESQLSKVLDELASAIENELSDLPFDFRPGLVGAYSYEGQATFMLVDRAIVLDHNSSLAYFLGVFETEQDFIDFRDSALLRLALMGGEGAVYRAKYKVAAPSSITSRHSDEEYVELIEQAKQSIAKGDAYQLCLTNQLTVETSSNPFAVFLELRLANPAPYSSFIRLGDVSIVSSSPEQFLRVTESGLLSSKPIKGTRKRSSDEAEDHRLIEELRTNEKERAENLMIVDLMRNDLGRVSEPSDVIVTKLFDVESYTSVHQLVSTVEARLKPGLTVFDAIDACFPAGSMTGAPKIRAIEILAGLEDGPRGLYSGCFGYITYKGAADLGMTIRTLVFEDGRATLGIGGGITIDSVALAELEETKLKAKALLSALGVEA